MSEPEFLTTEQAAAFLNCAPKTLRNKVYLGEIEVYYFGRRMRFTREDLRRAVVKAAR